MKKLYNRFLALAVALALALSLCSCAEVESGIHDMDSSITGHTYTCEFYSNDGEKFMTLTGDKIDMTPNIVREYTYNSDDGWGYVKTLSSVVTITVDGKQVNNCGSTLTPPTIEIVGGVNYGLVSCKSYWQGYLPWQCG